MAFAIEIVVLGVAVRFIQRQAGKWNTVISDVQKEVYIREFQIVDEHFFCRTLAPSGLFYIRYKNQKYCSIIIFRNQSCAIAAPLA